MLLFFIVAFAFLSFLQRYIKCLHRETQIKESPPGKPPKVKEISEYMESEINRLEALRLDYIDYLEQIETELASATGSRKTTLAGQKIRTTEKLSRLDSQIGELRYKLEM